MSNINEKEQSSAQLFDNNFDCYADREGTVLDVMAMTKPTFIKCTEYLQSRIQELEAQNKAYIEALDEITRTNWVNGKYFGISSAQLHLTATKIAEQALKQSK